MYTSEQCFDITPYHLEPHIYLGCETIIRIMGRTSKSHEQGKRGSVENKIEIQVHMGFKTRMNIHSCTL